MKKQKLNSQQFYLKICFVFLLSFFTLFAQDAKLDDGALVESQSCTAPAKKTYEQYLHEQKTSLKQETKDAERDGYKVD